MAFRNTPKLIYPIENINNISSKFRDGNFYGGKDWGIHLGVDIPANFETKVFSIGRGTVVYSKLHPAKLNEDGKINKMNWGGIVITAHKNPKTKKVFYSLYGHLGKRYVKKGDNIEMGELIGTIGKSTSESNGGWKEEHLHFGIYHGPFHGRVLPGYLDEKKENTKMEYWSEPIMFLSEYKNLNSKKNGE